MATRLKEKKFTIGLPALALGGGAIYFFFIRDAGAAPLPADEASLVEALRAGINARLDRLARDVDLLVEGVNLSAREHGSNPMTNELLDSAQQIRGGIAAARAAADAAQTGTDIKKLNTSINETINQVYHAMKEQAIKSRPEVLVGELARTPGTVELRVWPTVVLGSVLIFFFGRLGLAGVGEAVGGVRGTHRAFRKALKSA